MAVLLGEGDGPFGTAMAYATLPRKTMLAAGDGDLLVANVTKTLSQLVDVLAIGGGDFDGDGKLGLAIAWSDPGSDRPGAAGVEMGNDDGTFRGIGGTAAPPRRSRSPTSTATATST